MDDFDTEFEALWGRAYGVAYVVLGDRGESEDIAQETLARAHVRWDKVSAYAGPWVVRVAGNLAIDRVRKLIGDDQYVELAGTIAGYNMVSRFLLATGVEAEATK